MSLDRNELEAIDRMLGKTPVDISDEQFASRVVELLILAEGNLNRYQYTIEIALELYKRILERRKSCLPPD